MKKENRLIILIILILLVIGIILFFSLRPSEDISTNQSQDTELNQTYNENQNESIISNKTQDEPEAIPTPSEISGIDLRQEDGGYFCNDSSNPKHGARLYTYKIIGGIKILSEEFTESKKINNVCKNYPQVNLSEQGIWYNMRWRWQTIDNINKIDGYRIYQYYELEETNFTREYDYYVELPSSATMLLDDGLELWGEEKL
ncbi:MAG: hypothetical protein ABIG37_03875 [Nanoarchaeota archaeon]|nr:hypothetical protein [Nanoarchaeota archaeon]